MIVQKQINYVAGTHKSDSVNLEDIDGASQAKAVRVCNTSGTDVVLSCMDGSNIFTLTFPDKYCGWEPSTITRIRATGTSNDNAAGVSINLALQ